MPPRFRFAFATLRQRYDDDAAAADTLIYRAMIAYLHGIKQHGRTVLLVLRHGVIRTP